MRVIGAGVGRTGTHSTKKALEMLLGERCYHMEEVIFDARASKRWCVHARLPTHPARTHDPSHDSWVISGGLVGASCALQHSHIVHSYVILKALTVL